MPFTYTFNSTLISLENSGHWTSKIHLIILANNIDIIRFNFLSKMLIQDISVTKQIIWLANASLLNNILLNKESVMILSASPQFDDERTDRQHVHVITTGRMDH